MNKTLAVFISLGVILLIAGLTVVGIFGGEAIRNIKWDDVLNGKAHDLSLADTRIDYTAEELADKLTNGNQLEIVLKTQEYSVYVLPADDGVLSVRYVMPQNDETEINVTCEEYLNVSQSGNMHYNRFSFTRHQKSFIAVYIPQTEAFSNIMLKISCNVGGIRVSDVATQSVLCSSGAGSIFVDSCKIAAKIEVYTNTGTASVKQLETQTLTVKTQTGTVNVEGVTASALAEIKVETGTINCMQTVAPKLNMESETGSIKFDVTSNDIMINSDTGSVSGIIQGAKTDYVIDCYKDLGSSNLNSQNPDGATKYLYVNVDIGSVKINFADNA